ncbi:restriction endonuclease subunit S [Agathobacter rectalis]|uniref:restriction endonuclease subunit S n=1 Tax=Agathobacter rectalis TaxID=39491 RepID=UPI0027D30FFD|nr:restriction endonuclease subunit S [Agathobacter rectalis]
MENPKIRFKGFTKDWEQRKLGDLVDRVTRKNQDLVSELPLTISAQYGLIDQNEFFDKRVASKDVSGYYLIENGEFAYNKSTSTDAPWGAIKRLDRYENGVLSTLYIVFGIKENNPVDSDFLVSYYSTNLWHKGIHEIAAEGARNHGLLNIAPADFFETRLMIPQDIEEQKKIGKYFIELEALITLHQRKCEQTKNLKKYMLQKMFPQNGAKVPEIRFNGFTHDWEQRKLSDVLDIVTKRNGEKYGKEEVLSVSDEYGCINQIKFQGRSFAGEDISNYKIVDTGDIIYTRSPLKSKPYGIIKVVGDEIGIVSPLYIVNKVKEGNNSQFIYRVFDSPEKTNKYLSPLVRKGAKNTMNISNDEWLSGKIDVAPSYEEQYQIGLYFDHLDNLITLHQRQCDELKKMKKYMLQNMFI